MSDSADDALVLLEILELLGACRARVSYADVCVYLSGRYELQPLLELRSLLYSTACRDPCFPATLFRERLHPPCSNRLSAAADVVSLFNLLTHTRLPPSHTNTLTTSLACSQEHGCSDWLYAEGGVIASGCKYEDSTEALISVNTVGSHVNTPAHSLVHTHQRRSMQRAHSLDIPSGSTENQDSPGKVDQDVDHVQSCVQKRSIFKGEFHKLVPFISKDGSSRIPEGSKEDSEDEPFITCSNPYSESARESVHTEDGLTQSSETDTLSDAQTPYLQKHKSLDDLQSSTYFGPTVIERTYHQSPALTAKSHSLDIDCIAEPSDYEPGLDRPKPQRPRSEKSALDKSGLARLGFTRPSFKGSNFDIPGFDPFIVRSVRDTLKRLSGLSLDAWYDGSADAEGVVSVSTQTDLGDRRSLKSLLLSEKLSIDNTDIADDDISAIFRFLDDISMCGSMAILPADGAGAGSMEGGGAGFPERRERIGKLRRLFHSLEGPEEGVRWGVGRLLQRVTELEQRLEPISELREQLALILTTLNRLEQRGQLLHSHTEPVQQQPLPRVQSDAGLRASSSSVVADGAAAKRRGLFIRNSRSNADSSSSEQHREWSVCYSKEQHLHPSHAEHQCALCKKENRQVQERKSSIIIPEAHKVPLRSSMQKLNLHPTDRPKVSWSQSELTPLDLQAPESLDFWMDEVVYTPVSDTLLRRSQSLTRCSRTHGYRITAISITATVILILIIVIPICTV